MKCPKCGGKIIEKATHDYYASDGIGSEWVECEKCEFTASINGYEDDEGVYHETQPPLNKDGK